MKIYFIRHGIAEVFADTDFQRELTLEGRIKLNDTFRDFKKVFNESDYVVYTSPYVRTQQTAEIFCSKFDTDYRTLDILAAFNSEELLKELNKEKHDAYVIISHEPYISDCIYELTGRKENVSRGSIHIVEI